MGLMTTELTSSPSRPSIPWMSLYRDTVAFVKKPNRVMVSFFLLIALISLLMRPLNDFEWASMKPWTLFTSMTGALVLCAFNFFVFVAFVVWVWETVTHSARSLPELFRTTSALMVPITVLSVRGGILLVLGLFLLVLPGLYYLLKYELALFCLIFEGWHDRISPIRRAEQIMAHYRYSLLGIAGLMLTQAVFAWILEGILRWNEVEITFAIKSGIALLDAGLTLFVNVYLTLIALHLVRQVPLDIPEPAALQA